MDLLFKSLFQHYTAYFPVPWSVRTTIHFQDATCPYLKFTSIHTFSKSLSYLHICVLKGSRIIIIYFKTTTYQVGSLGKLPPCQNTTTSCHDAFLPFVQFMTNQHIEVIKNSQLVEDSQWHFNSFGPTSHFLTN